ncbi:uncharacterized protein MONBRDRAFT_35767 [Monosiga brevicollis MX1]|uniref:Uncharacterized protein n=1 Tax=Monosiga brevicollis TaxID=81824 RepID=A9URQ5_MONBE|nr:uncharacterized protein MONBRDRAFT_35767 [Monosiga brevicollis MX1]EDQ91967.1 predicted protein [Monosiga brevicollis MX1]|eukprot:XP_001743253.1 hypothetical protein [Monosiga brevicollis MX1]
MYISNLSPEETARRSPTLDTDSGESPQTHADSVASVADAGAALAQNHHDVPGDDTEATPPPSSRTTLHTANRTQRASLASVRIVQPTKASVPSLSDFERDFIPIDVFVFQPGCFTTSSGYFSRPACGGSDCGLFCCGFDLLNLCGFGACRHFSLAAAPQSWAQIRHDIEQYLPAAHAIAGRYVRACGQADKTSITDALNTEWCPIVNHDVLALQGLYIKAVNETAVNLEVYRIPAPLR